jgi:hypothetical protein
LRGESDEKVANFPKEWKNIELIDGFFELECPKCLKKIKLKSSLFSSKSADLPAVPEATVRRMSYINIARATLANIMAAIVTLIAVVIVPTRGSAETAKGTAYSVGIPVLIASVFIFRQIFYAIVGLWNFQCENCG